MMTQFGPWKDDDFDLGEREGFTTRGHGKKVEKPIDLMATKCFLDVLAQWKDDHPDASDEDTALHAHYLFHSFGFVEASW